MCSIAWYYYFAVCCVCMTWYCYRFVCHAFAHGVSGLCCTDCFFFFYMVLFCFPWWVFCAACLPSFFVVFSVYYLFTSILWPTLLIMCFRWCILFVDASVNSRDILSYVRFTMLFVNLNCFFVVCLYGFATWTSFSIAFILIGCFCLLLFWYHVRLVWLHCTWLYSF